MTFVRLVFKILRGRNSEILAEKNEMEMTRFKNKIFFSPFFSYTLLLSSSYSSKSSLHTLIWTFNISKSCCEDEFEDKRQVTIKLYEKPVEVNSDDESIPRCYIKFQDCQNTWISRHWINENTYFNWKRRKTRRYYELLAIRY